MKMKRFLVAPVLATALTLSTAGVTSAQDNNRNRSDRNSDRTSQASYQDRATDSQKCSICGLTVEKANGNQQGLKIVDIEPNSPADKAGLEKGDFVVSVDGQSIDTPDQLQKQMMQQQRQSSQADVNVRVRRDNRNRQVTLTLDRADRIQNQSGQNNRTDQIRSDANRDKDSQNFADSNDQSNRDQRARDSRDKRNNRQNDDNYSDDQASLGVTLDSNFYGRGAGVRIASVYTNSPAHRAGLKTGDRILKVEGQTVSNAGDVVRRIHQLDPNQSVDLTIMADGEEEELDIQLTSRAETIQRAMVDRRTVGNNGPYNSGFDGYDNSTPIRQGNMTQFSNSPMTGSNESLTQVLAGIRQELQLLRQQVSRLENGNRDRNDNYSSSRDRDRSSQQNRYDNNDDRNGNNADADNENRRRDIR
ncbi:PDZ domain-containing protein [Novipirellula rosea]|uniref:PDZ domain-containing protein n=1 Tax=Novipirellula rosea TaxID=1031540 RepID=A0ABP8NKB6_9BACT